MAKAKRATLATRAGGSAQSFDGQLTGEGPNAAWTFVPIPHVVSAAFGIRGRVSVRGTLNDFAFRSSIFPDGKGGHAMMVNKAMQAGAKAQQGDTVRVKIEMDDAPREVEVPPDLKKALKSNAPAAKWFAQLAPSCKKEFVEWVTGAKRPETRATRIGKLIQRLLDGKRRLDD